MTYQYDYAIFIGRLQPPHLEHINQIKRGLEIAKNVIVTLGSHRAASNIKNPWTVKEREAMVRYALSDLGPGDQGRVLFTKVRDYYYNDTTWFTDLQNSVSSIIDKDNAKICVIGCKKDSSSWYLDSLPEGWKRELTNSRNLMNASDIRNAYFQGLDTYNNDLPSGVREYLKSWKESDTYKNLCEEWQYIKDYKTIWAQAPYPVTFTTTDTLVVKNGHILVVKRRVNPGKGLLALPGGFIDQGELIIDSAMRELKEETRILLPKDILLKHVVDQKVFDHPDRSLRGRTITHAFCVKLPDGGQLPQVRGDDDAERAMWMPVADLYIREDEFFEDHCHMITYFVNKL